MRKLFTMTGLFALMIFLTSCGGKDAITYNNDLMTVINSNEKFITNMNSAMQAKNYDEAEKVRKDWEKNVTENINQVEKMGDFDGDNSFQKALLTGLNGYKKIVTDDYPKLIEIRKSGKEDAAAETSLLNNINIAFEAMGNGVNEEAAKFEAAHKK